MKLNQGYLKLTWRREPEAEVNHETTVNTLEIDRLAQMAVFTRMTTSVCIGEP